MSRPLFISLCAWALGGTGCARYVSPLEGDAGAAVDAAVVDVGRADLEDSSARDSRVDTNATADSASDTEGSADAFSPDRSQTADILPLDSFVPPELSWASVFVSAFQMGSTDQELCWRTDETVRQVTLTNDFLISTTEVTQEVFDYQMGYNPAAASQCGGDCPVESVTWHEAAAFCNALSEDAALPLCYSCAGTGADTRCSVMSGYQGNAYYNCLGYRLPTEAEFEFAYRAGTTTTLYNGEITNCTTDALVGAIGWYGDNAGMQPHPVALKAANALGLYDMAGNVWEWCHDWYVFDWGSGPVTDPVGAANGTARTKRGGSWVNSASYLRAARRLNSGTPEDRDSTAGFRCVRTLGGGG